MSPAKYTEHRTQANAFYTRFGNWLLLIILLICFYLTSFHSYLLFHSFTEIYAVIITIAIFFIAYNTRKYTGSSYLLFIGIAMFYIGIIQLMHTLAYKGMGVFLNISTDVPTQLWIVNRYIISLTFLCGAFFIKTRPKTIIIFVVYSVVSVLLVLSIFYWQIFPACYIENSGLTPFKIISEYVVCFIFLLSIFLLYKNRSEFDDNIYKLLIAALCFMIASGIAFTLYIDVYGITNMLGHLLMVVSFFLVYRAVIETGLRKPFSLLFRNLKNSEIRLEQETAQLLHTNIKLRREMEEREKAEHALRNYKDNLEKTINERTNELVNSYHNLEMEITERISAEEALRALSNRIVEMQEEERESISQDLHDQVGQSLTVLNLLLARIKKQVNNNDEQINSDLEEAKTIVTEIVQQIRALSTSLYPSMLDNVGLTATLEWYVAEFIKRTGIEIQLSYSGEEKQLSHKIKLTVYRTIQESLTNITRHADVREASIDINFEENQLSVVIEDKGKGFDSSSVAVTSSGIRGIRERIRAAGGSMQVDSTPGLGTRISVVLPLDNP